MHQNQVRQLSRDVAPDVDTWIAQAKQVQADIERSKVTAREIVEQAAVHHELQSRTHDASAKIVLLEAEVAFNDSLDTALASFRDRLAQLAEARDKITSNRLMPALKIVQEVEQKLALLDRYRDTKVHGLLLGALSDVKSALIQNALDTSKSLLIIDVKGRSVRTTEPDPLTPDLSLTQVTSILETLQVLQPWLEQIQQDIYAALFAPICESGPANARVSIKDNRAQIIKAKPVSPIEILDNVQDLVKFLSSRLPQSTHSALSMAIMPRCIEALQLTSLKTTTPLQPSAISDLEQLLARMSALVDALSEMGWAGGQLLAQKVKDAPISWLAAQRASALASVRSVLLNGLGRREVVQSVQPRATPRRKPSILDKSEDVWDQGWSAEGESAASPTSPVTPAADADMDDSSAWDTEDPTPQGEDVSDAWGWDQDDKAKGNSPVKSPSKSASVSHALAMPSKHDRYTVTAISKGVYQIIRDILTQANTLSEPQYTSSSIAPSVSALYSIPTQVLAMYRASATTVYSSAESSNMLIHNDTMHLCDSLSSLTTGAAPAVSLSSSIRARLAKDIDGLEIFAQRVYTIEIDSLQTMIHDHLDGAQGFSNCTTYPHSDACSTAVSVCVSQIQSIHARWSTLLSQSTLLNAVGSLLESAISKTILDILDLSDIGADESKQLKSYCDQISELRSLFTIPQSASNASTGSSAGMSASKDEAGQTDETLNYVPSWLRFQYLGEILESSLADIKYLWLDGELSLEFSQEEVLELIEALFADSEHRRRAIADVRAK